MSALIWWGVLAAYLAGLFPAAVRLTRASAGLTGGRCHSKGFQWTYRSLCRGHDDPGCWRRDEAEPTLRDAALGSAVAPLWPLALIPYFVLMHARGPSPLLGNVDEQIAAMERDLGIGGDR